MFGFKGNVTELKESKENTRVTIRVPVAKNGIKAEQRKPQGQVGRLF